MIISAIISVVVNVIFALLSVIPNVPAMPVALATPLTQFANMVGLSMGFLNHFLTPGIFSAAIFVAVALFLFDVAWAGFWFLIVKIPFISQHIHR